MNIKTFAPIILAFVALFSLPSLTHASITPSLSPSRTTGVAPLSVFFDASGTTASSTTLPFHELDYSWNFGDDDTATWTYGTRPGVNKKNRAYGPESAHVFEPTSFPDDCTGTPCKIFTVTLEVYDGTDTTTTTQTISVTDPDAVFSGTKTVCFSTSGTFTDCPSGASTVTDATGDFDAAIAANLATEKRLLFNRGETWSTSTNALLDVDGPWTIGAYGSGAKPIVLWTAGAAILQFGANGSNSYNDMRVMDLVLDPGLVWATPFAQVAATFKGKVDQVTFLRMDMPGGLVQDVVNTAGLTGAWDQMMVVDSTVAPLAGGIDNGNGSYIATGHLAILGCFFDNNGGSEHNLRTMYMDKMVISHNTFTRPHVGKANLTLRGSPWVSEGGPIPSGTWNEYGVISDNEFVGGSGLTGPMVSTSVDSAHIAMTRYILFERNIWTNQVSSQSALSLNSSYSTIRNNIFDFSADTGGNPMSVSNNTYPLPPVGNAIYNNTIYANQAGASSFFGIRLFCGSTDTMVKNNLLYAPSSSSVTVVNEFCGTTPAPTGTVGASGTHGNSSDNQGRLTNPLFLNTSGTFSQPGDFVITTGSYAIASGTTVPVYRDFYNNLRGATLDMGAFKQDSDPNDTTPPILSSITANVTSDTTATITWTTNELSDSTVNYGTTDAYGQTSTSASNITSHSRSLTGLTPGTIYHFEVISTDPSTNTTTSADQTFTTTGINPVIAPSRTTGVAPLSVFFDASGTTASSTTLPFHELDYSWNFGDDDTATWTYGTRPGVNKKNRAYGPESAHVFEPTSFPDDCTGTPCKIFTVTLEVYDGTDTTTTTQTISVTDPDAVFSGTNTICIAAASTPVAGAGGCPVGASVVQQSNFSTAINTYATTGKRVLFNRGDTFVGTAKAIFDDNGPWLVGAYGTGALPKIQNTAAVTILSIGTTVAGSYPSDGRIMDLEIDGENVPNRIGLWTDGNFEKLLLLRLNVHDVEDGIYFGNVFTVNKVGNTKLWDDLAIIENTVTHVMGGNGTHGIDGMGTRIAIMGNSVDDTFGSEHLMRFDYLYKSVIGHNTLLNGAASKESLAIRGAQNKGIFTITGDTHSSVTIDGIADTSGITAHASQGDSISGAGVPAGTIVTAKTADSITISNAATATASGVTLTLMGSGYSQYVLPTPVPTQYIVVSDNDIEIRDAYGIYVGPANGTITVTIEDIIMERNRFHAPIVTSCSGGPCAQFAIGSQGGFVTVRNNIADHTNWKYDGFTGLTGASSGMTAAHDVFIYNNSDYGSTDSLNGSLSVVSVPAGTTNVMVKNNLTYMPALSTPPGAVSRSVSCSPSPSDCSDRPDIVSSHNSTGSLSTNQIKLTNPFPTATPTTLQDFVITTGSYAIASGTIAPVYRDFYNNLRGATMDMGAFNLDSIPEDTIPPTVTSVNSDKGDGTYGIGEVIDIDISFSEAVTSTGNIIITLETGATDRTCTFTVSNSDTGTCNYTVQTGDTTGDLSVSSIAGTINDQSANPMTDFVPGIALETNKAFIIDTTPPTLTESSVIATSTDTTPDYTFSTTEGGSLTYGGDCTSSTTTATSGTNTITFTTLSAGTHTNCTLTVTDASSNASTPLAITSFTITEETIATPEGAGTSSSSKSKPKKKKISGNITYQKGERIAPWITLLTPTSNTSTNKKFTIKATSKDKSGIQAMFVSINGIKKKRMNTDSILYTAKKRQNASITVSAYDKLGNVKIAQITITDGKVSGVRYY